MTQRAFLTFPSATFARGEDFDRHEPSLWRAEAAVPRVVDVDAWIPRIRAMVVLVIGGDNGTQVDAASFGLIKFTRKPRDFTAEVCIPWGMFENTEELDLTWLDICLRSLREFRRAFALPPVPIRETLEE